MEENKKHPEKINRCVFTVATGKKYLNFAFTLARSYKFHNSADIPFFIVSDQDFATPADLTWVNKRILPSQIMGTGMSYRLNFDKIVPATQSVFIDADSIIYNNIAHLFEIQNDSIKVLGKTITTGKWVDLELPQALTHFKIDYLIRYGGAFYYIVKSDLTEKICNTAKQLANSNYSFQGHSTWFNDEPLFSISMAKEGIKPLADTGQIWTDTVQLKSHNDLNTLNKKALFNNSKEFRYKFWLPEGDYTPCIVHFGGGSLNKNPWLFDALRLKLYYQYHLPTTLSNFIVVAFIKPIYFFVKSIKQAFN